MFRENIKFLFDPFQISKFTRTAREDYFRHGQQHLSLVSIALELVPDRSSYSRVIFVDESLEDGQQRRMRPIPSEQDFSDVPAMTADDGALLLRNFAANVWAPGRLRSASHWPLSRQQIQAIATKKPLGDGTSIASRIGHAANSAQAWRASEIEIG
jgi:hypothetical protein